MRPREYANEQVSVILGVPTTLTDEQADRFWAAFSRQEERHALRDTHGNFPPERAELMQVGVLENPPLHGEILALEHRYATAPPRWPRGHRFAACLTHDVDRIVKLPWRERWREMMTLWGTTPWPQKARWSAAAGVFALGAMLGQSDIALYDPWMDAEARHGFHSTFFVLPEHPLAPTTHDHFYRYADAVGFRGQRMPFAEATRQAHAAGWEIGLHGSYMSAFDERIFTDDKAQLETLLAAPVRSARLMRTPATSCSAGTRINFRRAFI